MSRVSYIYIFLDLEQFTTTNQLAFHQLRIKNLPKKCFLITYFYLLRYFCTPLTKRTNAFAILENVFPTSAISHVSVTSAGRGLVNDCPTVISSNATAITSILTAPCASVSDCDWNTGPLYWPERPPTSLAPTSHDSCKSTLGTSLQCEKCRQQHCCGLGKK